MNTVNNANATQIDVFDKLFGGVDKFKQRLVNRIKDVKDQKRVTCDDVDKACYFGMYSSLRKNRFSVEFPQWQEIENNPSLITGDIFRRASLALGISVTSALEPKEIQDLMQLKWNSVEIVASCSGNKTTPNVNKMGSMFVSCVMGLFNQLR